MPPRWSESVDSLTRCGAIITGSPIGCAKRNSCYPVCLIAAPVVVMNYHPTSVNGLMVKSTYELHRQLHEFGRAGFDHHLAYHSGALRCEEIAGTSARHGSSR